MAEARKPTPKLIERSRKGKWVLDSSISGSIGKRKMGLRAVPIFPWAIKIGIIVKGLETQQEPMAMGMLALVRIEPMAARII